MEKNEVVGWETLALLIAGVAQGRKVETNERPKCFCARSFSFSASNTYMPKDWSMTRDREVMLMASKRKRGYREKDGYHHCGRRS
ncbi:MAG TPA: hypothetical protein VJH94_01620 [Candidatus Paceibacterota bacterium]